MKILSLKLPSLRGDGVNGVAPKKPDSGESRVLIACRDTIAAWSELISRISEAEPSEEGDIEVARLRFELALSLARSQPCADARDTCLKVLLYRELEEWAGDEDQRVRSFQRQLFREMSEHLLNTHKVSITALLLGSADTPVSE